MQVAAIIPAAGQGTRLGGQTKKQFRLLAGKPLLVRTLEQVLGAREVRWLVVAVPESHLDASHEMLQAVVPAGVEWVVTIGGTTRQQSVAAGLLEVPPEAPVVTVHDAARPSIDPLWITQTADLCREFDGAIVAVPAVDTLKEVKLTAGRSNKQGGIIGRTISREIIWQAQTPQTFRTDVLRRALQHAEEAGLEGTDESSLVEAIGGRVAIVRGSAQNIKVTSRDDWEYLEWKLSQPGGFQGMPLRETPSDG